MTSSEIDEIRVTIERDLEWRQSEIVTLKNLLGLVTSSSAEELAQKRGIIRKSIILSLYAHFEGYFRFAFETYAYALNETRVELNKVIDVLLISALNEDFEAYDDSNRWITPNPDEVNKKVKKLYNRLKLINTFESKSSFPFEIPIADAATRRASIIHTESNLNPDVIDKILYSLGVHRTLGLDNRQFMQLMGLTKELVRKRNGIAHGDNRSEFRDGVSERDFLNFESTFNTLIALIAPIITNCLTDKLYLKQEHRAVTTTEI